MNIVLIGHRGYVGRGLASYWKNKHTIFGWDKEENVFRLNTHYLLDKHIDAIVNLSVMADRQSIRYLIDTPTDEVNVQGARHLAQILKGTHIAWMQMSTREVFGLAYTKEDVRRTKAGFRPKWLVHEKFPYQPINSYAKSKIIAEFISESHPYSNVIRLSTCYTDYDNPNGNWVVHVIKQALLGKPLRLTQGGLLFRDPMHADDLGRLIDVLLKKKIYSQKIHAGGGNANIISLLEFILMAVPKAKYIKSRGTDYGFAFDIRKAYQLTGWKPKVRVREKIPIIVDAVKRGLAETTTHI